jgi:hypothetical protein
MARQMIEIKPDTDAWRAWLKHHRGSKTELVMTKCKHDARPFFAWTEYPPEAPRADGLSGGVRATPEPAPQRHVPDEGEIEKVADRVEARTARAEQEVSAATERSDQLRAERWAFDRATDAVLSGQSPSLNDLPNVGIQMIDDPLELQRGRKPKPLRAKLVNLRDDPIGQMAKRGQIEADQLSAARKWQAIYDTAASIGCSRGIDPGAMKVDGGRIASEPINDMQMASIKQLEKLDRILGAVGAALVRSVLGDRITIAQAAAMMGDNSARGINHVGRRLRECLDTLVPCLGVEAKGRGRPIRGDQAEAAELSRYADNPLLYRAVHEARRKIV